MISLMQLNIGVLLEVYNILLDLILHIRWTVFVNTFKALQSPFEGPMLINGNIDFGLKFLAQSPTNLYGFSD